MSDENTEAAEQEPNEEEAEEAEEAEETTEAGGAGGGAEPTTEEKQWAMFLHLSPLLNFIVPIPFVNIIVPLIMWKMKQESAFISHAGKECINFQITVAIAGIISAILVFAVIGIALVVVVLIAFVVYTIIAALKTNDGEWYKFPYCLRLVK